MLSAIAGGALLELASAVPHKVAQQLRTPSASLFVRPPMSVRQSVHFSVRLSVCLSLCLSVRLSVCQSVCRSVCLSCLHVCPSVNPSVCLCLSVMSACLSVYPSVCPSVIRPSVRLSARLSARPAARPPVRLSVCLSVCPSVCPCVRTEKGHFCLLHPTLCYPATIDLTSANNRPGHIQSQNAILLTLMPSPCKISRILRSRCQEWRPQGRRQF